MSTDCVVIQFGNSDDKLTQRQWSRFVAEITFCVTIHKSKIHFAGSSGATKPWQNCCIVVDVPKEQQKNLFDELRKIAAKFKQESIAVMVGEVEFLKGNAAVDLDKTQASGDT